jgi:hypothetical protein
MAYHNPDIVIKKSYQNTLKGYSEVRKFQKTNDLCEADPQLVYGTEWTIQIGQAVCLNTFGAAC